MQTNPKEAFIYSYRFLRATFGHVAADVYDLLFTKRQTLFDKNLISSLDSWFFYRSSDLLQDFDGKRTKSMRKLDSAIEEMIGVGLIRKRHSVVEKYGSVRLYRISDKVFEQLQKDFGNCWMTKKTFSVDNDPTDDLD
jgi:hypothetical protein